MLRPENSLQNKAFYALLIGALGDWFSTRLGLSLGFVEGNYIAKMLMSTGSWIQTDFIILLICFTVPFLVNQITDEKTPKQLFWMPLAAGLLKLGVSVWNLTLILG
jgi:hypothetical protein